MGALKIDCYCNEKQMEKMVKMVANHLNDADRREIHDFDDIIGEVRVCVEFDNYMDSVRIKNAEVLDNEWDLLYEDSAVLTSRLRGIVHEYNRNAAESAYQAHHVLKDRWSFS